MTKTFSSTPLLTQTLLHKVYEWVDVEYALAKSQLNLSARAVNTLATKYPDAVAKSQLLSKFIAADALNSVIGLAIDNFISMYDTDKGFNVMVCGGWVGILPKLIIENWGAGAPLLKYCVSIDLDEQALIDSSWIVDSNKYIFHCKDIYDVDYTKINVVVNPIVEHLTDFDGWISMIPSGTIVLLTSTDFTDPPDHVNTVANRSEFLKQCALYVNTLYVNSFETPMYKRFLVGGVIK